MLQQEPRARRAPAPPTRDVRDVRRGTHAYVAYTGPAELRTAVARYVAAGLEHGERCIYVLGDRSLIEIVDALDAGGIDVPERAADGSLQIMRAHQVYMASGRFDARRTIEAFRTTLRRALDEGFVGLRAAAEMTWALGGNASMQELEAYEREVEELFVDGRYTGLCMYDAQRFGRSALSGIERAHSNVLRPEASPPAA